MNPSQASESPSHARSAPDGPRHRIRTPASESPHPGHRIRVIGPVRFLRVTASESSPAGKRRGFSCLETSRSRASQTARPFAASESPDHSHRIRVLPSLSPLSSGPPFRFPPNGAFPLPSRVPPAPPSLRLPARGRRPLFPFRDSFETGKRDRGASLPCRPPFPPAPHPIRVSVACARAWGDEGGGG